MASVHPAMRGKFGSTEYYMLTMKAGDVANQLTIPKEMPDWDELEIEERFQREINYNRVRKQIAPYLSSDPDRFFGALIVDVLNADDMEFEEMGNVSSKIPKLYQTASKAFGFLTLGGGEVLVPLDGQHRLAAIQFALSGKDERQRPIANVTPNPEMANDDVLLIMLKHDVVKGRKIFNKVNRYAKPTSKSDNLITADDDIVAVIARKRVSNELIGSRLVNYNGNTLSNSTHYFTTLPTIYEATKRILEDKFGRISDTVLPDLAKCGLYEHAAVEFWQKLLEGVSIYGAALADLGEGGDEKRVEIRKSMLLGKPFGQLVLATAVVRLLAVEQPDGSRMSWDVILKRINATDWSASSPLWQRVLMNGNRIVSGKAAANFGGRFVAYYLGEALTDEERTSLELQYVVNFPADQQDSVSLPAPLGDVA